MIIGLTAVTTIVTFALVGYGGWRNADEGAYAWDDNWYHFWGLIALGTGNGASIFFQLPHLDGIALILALGAYILAGLMFHRMARKVVLEDAEVRSED